MMKVDLLGPIVLAISGFAIGFVGGMVGLVLGVVRFPIVMGIETSASVTAGTNLGVSTLGAITRCATPLPTRKYSSSFVSHIGTDGRCWCIHRILSDWIYSRILFPNSDWYYCIV